MDKRRFMRAKGVAEELECSLVHTYKIINQLNRKMEKKGYAFFGFIAYRLFLSFVFSGDKGSDSTVLSEFISSS